MTSVKSEVALGKFANEEVENECGIRVEGPKQEPFTERHMERSLFVLSKTSRVHRGDRNRQIAVHGGIGEVQRVGGHVCNHPWKNGVLTDVVNRSSRLEVQVHQIVEIRDCGV